MPPGWSAYVDAAGTKAVVGNPEHPKLSITVSYGENNERHEFQPDPDQTRAWALRVVKALDEQEG